MTGAWTCPECGRQFARRGQGHECAPAMTLDEYFTTGPAFERPVFDAVRAHLDSLGEVFVEPVSVGLFVKRDGIMVLQLRPMVRWVALCLYLRREVRHPRIARKPMRSGSRVFHVVNVSAADEIDETVRNWITEAWETARSDT